MSYNEETFLNMCDEIMGKHGYINTMSETEWLDFSEDKTVKVLLIKSQESFLTEKTREKYAKNISNSNIVSELFRELERVSNHGTQILRTDPDLILSCCDKDNIKIETIPMYMLRYFQIDIEENITININKYKSLATENFRNISNFHNIKCIQFNKVMEILNKFKSDVNMDDNK